MNKNKILYKNTYYVIASVLIVAGFISLNITNYFKKESVDTIIMSTHHNKDFQNTKELEVRNITQNANANEDIVENFNDDKTNNKDQKIDDRIKELGEFEMTAYTSDCKGCIGITKTGYDVRNTIYYDDGSRIVAVDPNVIELHSRLRITMPNGEVIEAIALDTGGAIKGRRLDLLVENREKARVEVGRKRVKVELIK